MGLSPWEIAIVILVVVLLFGTRRLPELGSGLGTAIGNFKKALREGNTIDVTPQNQKIEEKKNEPPPAGNA